MEQDKFLTQHRRMLWALCGGFAVFLCWAVLARLDIVVTASGKLTPASTVPVAQPATGGVVKRILVKDGQEVEAGQPLVELDSEAEQEAVASATAEVRSLELQRRRLEGELAGTLPQVDDPAVLAEYASRRGAQDALHQEALRAQDRAEAELRTVQERLTKLRELAPVSSRQADMLQSLKQSGYVSEAAHNDKLLAKIESTHELAVQERAVVAARATLRQAEAGVEKVRTAYKQQLAVEKTEVLLRIAKANASLGQAEHRAGLSVLRAPLAGRVTGLSVFTPGRVVVSGEKLLAVLPSNEPLRFEGWLRNEDAALVAPGMAVKVKLAGYPFQKYGWLTGELTWIGVDAETPEAMKNSQGEPLFYRVRVQLSAQALMVDGQALDLRAGMQGVADVQVGTRTILEYLTSPMRKVVLEAAREH